MTPESKKVIITQSTGLIVPNGAVSDGLTVFIPTLNEEQNIAACIDSVGNLARQLLVFDSFSSDRTVEIAKSRGAEVVQREFDDFASQKNAGLKHARESWILILDADERLTELLRQQIAAIITAGQSEHSAYSFPRRAYFEGHPLRCWSGQRVIRLFRNQTGQYLAGKLVHEELRITGSVGQLSGVLEHHTFRSFEQYLPKMQRFTTLAATEAFAAGKRARWYHFLFLPPAKFLRMYFLRGGIADGMPGLLIAWLSAFSIYLKCAKLWELQSKD